MVANHGNIGSVMTVPISSEVALIGPQRAGRPARPVARRRRPALSPAGDADRQARRYRRAPPGIRLPPERALAAALAVSRNTVALAYQVLRDDGMAESRQGSGTRLMPHRITPAAAHRANGYFAGMLGDAVAIDLSIGAVECAPVVAEALQSPGDVLGAARAVPAHPRHRLPPVRAARAPRGDRVHAHHRPRRPHVGGRGAGHHRRPAGAGPAGPAPRSRPARRW